MRKFFIFILAAFMPFGSRADKWDDLLKDAYDAISTPEFRKKIDGADKSVTEAYDDFLKKYGQQPAGNKQEKANDKVEEAKQTEQTKTSDDENSGGQERADDKVEETKQTEQTKTSDDENSGEQEKTDDKVEETKQTEQIKTSDDDCAKLGLRTQKTDQECHDLEPILQDASTDLIFQCQCKEYSQRKMNGTLSAELTAWSREQCQALIDDVRKNGKTDAKAKDLMAHCQGNEWFDKYNKAGQEYMAGLTWAEQFAHATQTAPNPNALTEAQCKEVFDRVAFMNAQGRTNCDAFMARTDINPIEKEKYFADPGNCKQLLNYGERFNVLNFVGHADCLLQFPPEEQGKGAMKKSYSTLISESINSYQTYIRAALDKVTAEERRYRQSNPSVSAVSDANDAANNKAAANQIQEQFIARGSGSATPAQVRNAVSGFETNVVNGKMNYTRGNQYDYVTCTFGELDAKKIWTCQIMKLNGVLVSGGCTVEVQTASENPDWNKCK